MNLKNNAIENYGYTDFFRTQMEKLMLSDGELIPGRVIEVQKEQYKIITEYGENSARLKGSIFYNGDKNIIYPTVGDFVIVKPNPLGDDTIYYVLERKSKFSRLDSFNNVEQLVAANFDYVFIMTSLNKDFNIKRIERYLGTAWQSGATPVIVLTKADLCNDEEEMKCQVIECSAGVEVIAVSSLTGEGITELEAFIKPKKSIVFLGSSGVGKSSLINAIAKKEIMKVNDIREDDSKGRHTTTHRQLIMLDNGAMIIDTPGMRELGLWNVREGLDAAFSDIDELSEKCRFRDCSHEREPGCAVKAALLSGELSEERWKNYIKLKKEAKFAESKENINIRLKEKARMKSISKFQKGLSR